jgi:hypothetical protein
VLGHGLDPGRPGRRLGRQAKGPQSGELYGIDATAKPADTRDAALRIARVKTDAIGPGARFARTMSSSTAATTPVSMGMRTDSARTDDAACRRPRGDGSAYELSKSVRMTNFGEPPVVRCARLRSGSGRTISA